MIPGLRVSLRHDSTTHHRSAVLSTHSNFEASVRVVTVVHESLVVVVVFCAVKEEADAHAVHPRKIPEAVDANSAPTVKRSCGAQLGFSDLGCCQNAREDLCTLD
jgi:hypothetical protein